MFEIDSFKIGDVILVATQKSAVEQFQRRAGYGEQSKWTHVCGCLGGWTCIEARFPRARLVDIKKEYLERGFEIKHLRRRAQSDRQRYKVALWWATMNNLPYDALQFFWTPLALVAEWLCQFLHCLFSSKMRFVCSELIAEGFYKEGDYVFGKPAHLVVPADFANPALFEEVERRSK
ncbi:MAG: hypothetical protein N2606_02605 [Candidatus Omnitrophica bacterium]|nr:hypothetical protein [Candidatus Omnitrophota bacterium]